MAADPYDDFSKFFLPDEWAALSPKERYQNKIQFLVWLSGSAEADSEVNKPDFMKKYDIRRAKILAERHESLKQSKSKARGNKTKSRKQPESDSLPYQEVLKGFSELEISEAQAAVLPLQARVQRCLNEFDSSDSDASESNIYKKKYRLRGGKRVNYNEDKEEEKDFDEFIYCPYCDGYYLTDCCLKHPLLIMPDDKVSEKLPGQTMAELTCPSRFLKIAPSSIPGAGLGVFTRRHLPRDVRFGPNRGVIVSKVGTEGYTWQTSETSKKKKQLVDSASPDKSNWLRYFNCARSSSEQNTTVFQYQGELYYRTMRNVPPDTELLIFYGIEYAKLLGIDMERYHLPLDATIDTDLIDNGEKEKYTCECCQLTIFTQNRLIEHRNICGKLSPSIIAEDIHPHNRQNTRNARNTQHRHLSPERMMKHVGLTCNVCQKIFSKSHLLKTHMKLHRERSYEVTTTSCDTSNLGSERQAGPGLTRDNQHACQVCLKKFTRKDTLTIHMRTHTGDKPYICEVCNKGFTQSIHLTGHMRTHTGDKPYICEVCNKGFTQSGHLTSHMRTHTGDKPYICEVCNKGFTDCSNLTSHMRIHTGDKPYICEVCNEGFTQSSPLTTHMRTHTEERPYKCKECNKDFTARHNLSYHMKHSCKTSAIVHHDQD